MQVFAVGDAKGRRGLARACEWCGLETGNYCDGEELDETIPKPLRRPCLAINAVPHEEWEPLQRTPLCTLCERQWGKCNQCLKVPHARWRLHEQQSDRADAVRDRFIELGVPWCLECQGYG